MTGEPRPEADPAPGGDRSSPWRTLTSLPAAVRVLVGALVIVLLTIAAFIAYDLITGDDPEDAPTSSSNLIPTTKRDRAILRAAGFPGVTAVEVRHLERGEYPDIGDARLVGDSSYTSRLDDGAERWQITLTGWFTEPRISGPGGPLGPIPTPAPPACRQLTYWFRDGEPQYLPTGYPFPGYALLLLEPFACELDGISRDHALLIAADGKTWPNDSPAIALTQTTFAEATGNAQTPDVTPIAIPGAFADAPNPDTSVWLVLMHGERQEFPAPTQPGGPRTTDIITCTQTTTIIDAKSGKVLLESSTNPPQCP